MISLKCFDVLNSAMIHGRPDIVTDYDSIPEIVAVATRVYRWAKWQKKISDELRKRHVPSLTSPEVKRRRVRKKRTGIATTVLRTNVKTYKAIVDIRTSTSNVYDKLINEIECVKNKLADVIAEGDYLAKQRGELIYTSEQDIETKIVEYNKMLADQDHNDFADCDVETKRPDRDVRMGARVLISTFRDSHLHIRMRGESEKHYMTIFKHFLSLERVYPVLHCDYRPTVCKYLIQYACHYGYKMENETQKRYCDKKFIEAFEFFHTYYQKQLFAKFFDKTKMKQFLKS